MVKEYKTKLSSTSKVLEISTTKENIIVAETAALSVTSDEAELSDYRFKVKINEMCPYF